MNSRRAVIVSIAVVLGLVAAGLVVVYLRGVQDRAYDNAQLVEVFVVKKDIPREFPGEQVIAEEYITSDVIPQRFRPANALTNINDIRGKVALAPLSVNQVLVDGQFVDPRQAQVTFSQNIGAGRTAVTVQVDQVRGVAGLLVAGDKVNLMVLSGTAAQYLYQAVEIIAIGNTVAPQPGETEAVVNPGSGLITFSVPVDAATKIAYASQLPGGLYLTLLPPDYQPAPTTPINAANLFTGGLTPYDGR